jgi:predicted dehydrogenase
VSAPLRIAIAGCGLIGGKRADALGESDAIVGTFDVLPAAAERLGAAVESFDALLALRPDVVVVATSHDELAGLAVRALEAGAHVLVEKPAGVSARQVESIAVAAERSGRHVKVGFNHRFHPGIARVAAEVQSGRWGEVMHVRGRYGHGGRIGYDREWRADPSRSGGGELIDQGMHLIDLSHWILGPLPLHSALLRTQFWDTPVDDNAALLLGEAKSRTAPWATLHVSWTEWKNLFSLEVYCRTAKFHVEGLVRSYGPQKLRIFSMKPELGPPDVEEIDYQPEDLSWVAEWENFRAAIDADDPALINGGLPEARYAWQTVEAAYAAGGYADMRAQVHA